MQSRGATARLVETDTLGTLEMTTPTRIVVIIALAAGVLVAPPKGIGSNGLPVFGPTFAQAESGKGRDGDGRSDDREDDRDGDRDDEDDRDDDRTDDSSGSGSSDRDRRDTSPTVTARDNISLVYSNGWREWVLNGRYVLIDPQGRTVADRIAGADDVIRLRQLAGH